MLSPNLLKFQSPILGWGEEGGWQPTLTFDVESKSANFPKSHYGVGGWGVVDNQLLTFDADSKSAKIPKSHYAVGKEVGIQLLTFDAESKSATIPESHFGVGREVGGQKCPKSNFKT